MQEKQLTGELPNILYSVMNGTTKELKQLEKDFDIPVKEWTGVIRWAADTGKIDMVDFLLSLPHENDDFVKRELLAGLEYAIGNLDENMTVHLAGIVFDNPEAFSRHCNDAFSANSINDVGWEFAQEKLPLVTAEILSRKHISPNETKPRHKTL